MQVRRLREAGATLRWTAILPSAMRSRWEPRQMSWLDTLRSIEALRGRRLRRSSRGRDGELAAAVHSAAGSRRAIRFSTPTFKEYSTSEMKGCSKNSFPGVLGDGRRLRARLRSLPGEDPRADDPGDDAGDARRQGARSRPAAGPAGLPAVGRLEPAQRDQVREVSARRREAEARLPASEGRDPFRAAGRAPRARRWRAPASIPR